MNKNILQIRYPLNLRLVISMLLLILTFLFSILRSTEEMFYYSIALILCTAILTIALVRRLLIKPRTIRFENKTLIIDNQFLNANAIKNIFIYGSTVGIRILNKRIVPIKLCFEFINKSEGMETINDWAQENNIQVIRGNFIKWI